MERGGSREVTEAIDHVDVRIEDYRLLVLVRGGADEALGRRIRRLVGIFLEHELVPYLGGEFLLQEAGSGQVVERGLRTGILGVPARIAQVTGAQVGLGVDAACGKGSGAKHQDGTCRDELRAFSHNKSP